MGWDQTTIIVIYHSFVKALTSFSNPFSIFHREQGADFSCFQSINSIPSRKLPRLNTHAWLVVVDPTNADQATMPSLSSDQAYVRVLTAAGSNFELGGDLRCKYLSKCLSKAPGIPTKIRYQVSLASSLSAHQQINSTSGSEHQIQT